MILDGHCQLLITYDPEKFIAAGGRTQDNIGYIMQRLLTGQEAAAAEELSYWGIEIVKGDCFVSAGELRSATEDDVALALADSVVAEIGDVGADKLLEFHNAMLDQRIGCED